MARVLLVFGGRSAEHEISCLSSVAIVESLTGAGHDVVAVGIDRRGGWHMADPKAVPLQAVGPEASFVVPDGTIRGPGGEVEFDVVFPVLHGPNGEDGTLQGMLEMTGSPYVGSGVLASAICMEKDVAKRLFLSAGIPTAAFEVVNSDQWASRSGDTAATVVEALGFPVFVKPAEMGSSIGVAQAGAEEELKQAVEDALAYGDKVIVEETIEGREIEVAVLEGPRISVPGEILTESGWYTYDAKYVDETSRFVAPAPLTEAETATVQEYAGRAFTALECRGLARVDFLFEEGGRGFLINEINTMPGFTPISGFPKMWEASGMPYAELCRELVRLALDS
jgi:D-alanine-D-alanine ligase